MKNIMFIFGLLLSHFGFSQCVSCYSIEEAMKNPFSVKELILTNKGLTEIPTEVAKLKNLEILDLSYNSLSEIGASLNANLKLRSVNFSSNVGLSLVTAADSFFLLPTLETLDLSNNAARYISPNVGDLSSLQTLILKNNKLEYLPQTLSDLPRLKHLDIAGNKMKEAHMAFADLWKLNYLDISGNFEEHQYETFKNLQYKGNLKVLRCSLNDIDKNMAVCLNTTGIEELIIVDSKIEKIHGTFSRNKTLQKITFENSEILNGSSNYRRLNSMHQLEELAFVQTSVSPAIKDMAHLKKVEIDNSNVPVEALTKNKSITSLAWTDDKQDVTPLLSAIQGNKKEFSSTAKKISVSPAMKENNVTPIAALEPKVKKMDGSKAAVLVFKDSECAIQKETFLDANGKPYTGEVSVEVTEYFDPVVNAITGVPMSAVSPTGELEVFSSNGMINFLAKDEKGNELQIDPLKPVQVTIRDIQPQQPTELFAFDQPTQNWVNMGVPVQTGMDSVRALVLDSLRQLDDALFYNLTTIQPHYRMRVSKSRKDPYTMKLWTPRVNFKAKKITKTKTGLMYYSKREDMRYLSRKTWYLDTVITPEMDSLFKAMNREMKNDVSWVSFYMAPRFFKDIRIVPDLEHDNYRMEAIYKGDSYSFPVYFTPKGSLASQVNKHKQFYSKYHRKLRKFDRKQDKLRVDRAEELKKMAEFNRRQMVEVIASTRMGVPLQMQAMGNINFNYKPSIANYNQVASFGITLSGLTNCDRWYRANPDEIALLSDTLLDQNGDAILTPTFVRFIDMERNAYYEVSSQTVPYFKKRKSLVILVLSSIEIAVVTAWETVNGKLKPIVKRINVEGKNPETIKREIYKP